MLSVYQINMFYLIINVFCSMQCDHSEKMVNSSAERNKQPILEIVKKYFDKSPGNVLEISSGTGQHLTFMAPHFPNLTFQPSEYETRMLPQIRLYIDSCPSKNVKQPLRIDVTTPIEKWGLHTKQLNYIININMIHITPYTCTQHLFKSAGALLIKNGLLITYGPYSENNILTPISNVNFDRFLRDQNSEWGVRDINDLKKEANNNGLDLKAVHEMPSNNKCLIWIKL